MILKDDKVLLRAVEESDQLMLLRLINSPEIENSVVGWSAPVSLNDQKRWMSNLINDTTIRYTIEYEENPVGIISVSNIDFKNRTANLNIKLISDIRRKGVAKRAVKLVIHYCYEELNLHTITANVIERNSDSRYLWEKFGFQVDGVLRDRVFKNGTYHNIIAYSLLKEEFYERSR